MKKSVVKKQKKILAVEKQVMIFPRSNVAAAVFDANAEIRKRNPAWEAKPIEFVVIPETGTFQVTVNFKKNGKGDGSLIAYSTNPDTWNFTLTKNHPNVSFGGIVYYLGIV